MYSEAQLRRAVRGGVKNFCDDHPEFGIPYHMRESLVKRIVGQVLSLTDCGRGTGQKKSGETGAS